MPRQLCDNAQMLAQNGKREMPVGFGGIGNQAGIEIPGDVNAAAQ